MLDGRFRTLGQGYDFEKDRLGWLPAAWQLGEASDAEVMVTCRLDDALSANLNLVSDWWLTENARLVEPMAAEPNETQSVILSRTGAQLGRGEWISHDLHPQSFETLLASVDTDREGRAGWMLSDFGAAVEGEPGRASADVDLDESGWVQFEASVTVVGRHSLPRAVPDFWVVMVESLARGYEITYAEVAPGCGNYRGTSWEGAHGIRAEDGISASASALRGAGWFTFIPKVLAERLGGPDAFTNSGAFLQATPLAGGVLAQATETFSAFDEAARQRIETFLQPVLVR